MKSQEVSIDTSPKTTFEVINSIICIKINLLRIPKIKDKYPYRNNLDYLREKMKKMAKPELIKEIFDLINKHTVIDHIYHCQKLTNVELDKEDNIDFSFEQILDETFYNE